VPDQTIRFEFADEGGGKRPPETSREGVGIPRDGMENEVELLAKAAEQLAHSAGEAFKLTQTPPATPSPATVPHAPVAGEAAKLAQPGDEPSEVIGVNLEARWREADLQQRPPLAAEPSEPARLAAEPAPQPSPVTPPQSVPSVPPIRPPGEAAALARDPDWDADLNAAVGSPGWKRRKAEQQEQRDEAKRLAERQQRAEQLEAEMARAEQSDRQRHEAEMRRADDQHRQLLAEEASKQQRVKDLAAAAEEDRRLNETARILREDPINQARERARRGNERVAAGRDEPPEAIPADQAGRDAMLVARERERREEAERRKRLLTDAGLQQPERQTQDSGAGVAKAMAAHAGLGGVGDLAMQLGSGAALEAVPLVGAIVEVAEMAKKAISDTVTEVGRQGAQVGSLDTRFFTDNLQKAAQGAGIFGTVLGPAVKGLIDFDHAIDGTAQRLARYEGSLALAQGQAEARQIISDIRRAQQLGPELANFTTAQSQLSQTAQDVLADMLEPLIPPMTKFLEDADEGLTAVAPILDFVASIAGFILQFDASVIKGVLETLQSLGIIAKKLDKDHDSDVNDQFLDQLFKSLMKNADTNKGLLK
jgi:hypothetical protein